MAKKLMHNGFKNTRGKPNYLLPQKIMDTVFNELDGKNGNQLKLMVVLLGTIGDGSFKISNDWIYQRTGMDQSAYSRARAALIERGWIELSGDKIILNVNKLLTT